jgi:hypothetical protein
MRQRREKTDPLETRQSCLTVARVAILDVAAGGVEVWLAEWLDKLSGR